LTTAEPLSTIPGPSEAGSRLAAQVLAPGPSERVAPIAAFLLGTFISFSAPVTAAVQLPTLPPEFKPGYAAAPDPAVRPELALVAKARSFALKSLPDGNLDDRAIEDAEDLLWRLVAAKLPFPVLRLAEDGEINFSWRKAGAHIDLGVYGDGNFSFYARTSEGREFTEDAIAVADGLPAQLAAILRQMA
jgi:hypothetical protein